MKTLLCAAVVSLALPGVAAAQRGAMAREAAEFLIAKGGSKAGVPHLAARIEGLAARHGDDAIAALRRGGHGAVELVEAAGPDAGKALSVLARHGEAGAARVLSRPWAMKHFLAHGDECASVLVRHPGVAEPLIEKGGAAAVKALGAVNPQNGRRLAMVLDGELAGQAAKHPEVLNVVARHGDRATEFLYRNRATLAGGAALTSFLASPEPFLDGSRDILSVAGENVAKPAVDGLFTLLNVAAVVLGALGLAVVGLAYKHGPPKLDAVRSLFAPPDKGRP